MNRSLMQRVRDHILAEPDHFNMEYWFSDDKNKLWNEPARVLGRYYGSADLSGILEDCGTAACIAGTAVLLAGDVDIEQYESWFTLGAGALELPDGLARHLFYRDRWPEWVWDLDEEGHQQGRTEFLFDNTEATIAAMLLDIILDGDDPWSLHPSDGAERCRKAAPRFSINDVEFARGFNEAGE